MYCLYNSRMLLPSDCVFSRSSRTHVRLESYHIAIFSDMLYNSDRGDYCAYNNIKFKSNARETWCVILVSAS